MPSEVVSPATPKGSKVGGNIPGSSPRARSMPTDRRDSVPPQPAHGGGGRVAPYADEPAELKVTGPGGVSHASHQNNIR